MQLENITAWLNTFVEQNPQLAQLAKIGLVLLLSAIAYFTARIVVNRVLVSIIKRTSTARDDLLLKSLNLNQIAVVAALIILYCFSFIFPAAADVINTVVTVFIIGIGAGAIASALDMLVEIYRHRPEYEGVPIKGYLEIIKIVAYVIAAILIISTLSGKSPFALLAGLGAVSAVIILIFQDTILSLVASYQITSHDLIRVGDWIEVPGFGADGDVFDVALHTIQVQNFDKTISVIPTYKVLSSSFRNWRGMTDSGVRRIKRAILIDMDSIRLCDEDMLRRFESIDLIREYIQQKTAEIRAENEARGKDANQSINSRRLTNVGTFRAYVWAYLTNHPAISKDATLLVRQLDPTSKGLPLEIYAFTNDTRWKNYEDIQSDIFDHLLAVVREFELEVFQDPTGYEVNIDVTEQLNEKQAGQGPSSNSDGQ